MVKPTENNGNITSQHNMAVQSGAAQNHTNYCQFSGINTSDFEPEFHAISTQSGRHGIRLETSYWNALKAIANMKGVKVGALVETARQSVAGQKNLASALRVMSLECLKERVGRLEDATSDRIIRGLIHACPTPALALSSQKKLLSFNQSFLMRVTNKFSIMDPEIIPARLRLILEDPMEQLLLNLLEDIGRPTQVNIAIAVDNRKMDSRMTFVMAPCENQNVVIGFMAL